ncbi:hypothetical protein [Mucilaginibacter kameinonensis]|uniref:hypothetical protein n=1 Tax=Mucilaginibacter kameinonensis TaxID=452286 RepID=UPI000EF7CCCB|nr:hypothetical protein [Mucilaginibacter kameinonensis]
MKKIFLVTIIFLLTSAALHAQANRTIDTTDYIHKLAGDLDIAPALAAKVSTAMRANEAQMASLIKRKDLKPDEKQRQFQLLNSEREAGVNALLNAGQQQRLSELIMQRIGRAHFARKDSLFRVKEKEKYFLSKHLNSTYNSRDSVQKRDGSL